MSELVLKKTDLLRFTFWWALLCTHINTTVHKYWVMHFLFKFAWGFLFDELAPVHYKIANSLYWFWRGLKHDIDKYTWFQGRYFSQVVFKLKTTTYGSEDYFEMVKQMQPAVERHYKVNLHHPEHFKNGFNEMEYFDKVEMMADWCASTKKHNDGNIWRSLDVNQKRFQYSDGEKEALAAIVRNMI